MPNFYVNEHIILPPVDRMTQDFACRDLLGSSFQGQHFLLTLSTDEWPSATKLKSLD